MSSYENSYASFRIYLSSYEYSKVFFYEYRYVLLRVWLYHFMGMVMSSYEYGFAFLRLVMLPAEYIVCLLMSIVMTFHEYR